MNSHTRIQWIVSIISLVVFILTFFIFFRETRELFSSGVAAIFSSLLVAVALMISSWLIKVFNK
ncbi:MAG: hypothetical protein ACH350_02350 [Parachlamydiaceae bacterium]